MFIVHIYMYIYIYKYIFPLAFLLYLFELVGFFPNFNINLDLEKCCKISIKNSNSEVFSDSLNFDILVYLFPLSLSGPLPPSLPPIFPEQFKSRLKI